MHKCGKCDMAWWWEHIVWQALTKPPEETACEADNKEHPDLVKALLGSRQKTAMQQLLEKFLAAKGGHCRPPQMYGQMDRPANGERVDTEGARITYWARDGHEH